MADCEEITPYGDASGAKGGQVKAMFDNIAPAYDFMNRAMTLGVDKLWRRSAVKTLRRHGAGSVLDVATGTGDLAIQIAGALADATVTGIDLSEKMIEIGRRKIADSGLGDRISLMQGDCLALPMADGSFDAVTVAYGVRNFENLAGGYAEMARVLRPGGLLMVLELSTPQSALVRPLYNIYTRCVIPAVGKLISHDSGAYSYLPKSIEAVPQGERMLDLMRAAGLADARCRRFTFGVCSLYTAVKPR
ncbi:bifunctional demethylmenaquinone methyltransferase/2-methoxy-6-polyprenyl-1,4-benzoquinol methylase UbiE [Muribaculaceae bacterium Isolate-104 (HZI)]|jgi:demethylmenaquinone methyltransferase/2-methoxy-6-polyprenyl-1,4-benzoquinol methylase|nr:bifunctional demethylmenaquinone methyltransferase/2-methoxy-6-polyprenyl-1,4-benzoquinol methylase UbiE [Muribaculaceae bacterium Isolate-104 (HZI)]